MLGRGSIGGAVLAAVLLLGGSASIGAAPSPTATAFLRVNQVGYPAASSKRAYLMSSVAETGATFSVKNASGATVLSGPIGANLGSWSGAYSFVYALDFGAVTTAGTYSIAVTGPADASSPTFRIDTAQNVYSGAVANALFFYQTERDGRNYVPNALRTAPAHLNDENAMTYLTPNANSSGRFSGDLTPLGTRIDASGGWWDAGDYIKGVQTLSYTDALLGIAARDFPSQLGSGFAVEATFGADWLSRMWDGSTKTFYYQVGIGTGNAKTVGDHDIWRLPQADDTYGGTDPLYRYIRNRPVLRAGPPGAKISPNLAGRTAAALALCYQLNKKSNATLANKCLLSAEQIFDLADTAPTGDLTTYLPFSFYPETEWRSDLELGAVELYFALAGGRLPAGLPQTDPSFYLAKAAHWAREYISSPDDAADTLNLYDVSGLAHYELHKAIGQAGATGLEVTQAGLVADLKKALDGAIARATTDSFQFGFPWATWDTQSHGAGLSVMASEYAQLTGSREHADWSGRWLGNILGANAWGSSFIVGDGTTFPHCIHHQVANLVGSLDGTGNILRGAGVEGPNGTVYSGFLTGMNNCPPDDSNPFAQFDSKAKFKDDIESFSTVEPGGRLDGGEPARVRVADGAGAASDARRDRPHDRRLDPVRRRRRRPVRRAADPERARDARHVLRKQRLRRRLDPHDVGTATGSLRRGERDRRPHAHARQHQAAEDGRRAGRGLRRPRESLRPRLPAHVVRVSVRLLRRRQRAGGEGLRVQQRPRSRRRDGDDPAARPVRDPDATEPEAGDDARHHRELRDGGRAERRRLGSARLPPPLQPVRRLLDHAGRLHGAARLAPAASCGWDGRRDDDRSDRRCCSAARRTLTKDAPGLACGRGYSARRASACGELRGGGDGSSCRARRRACPQ